MGAFAAGALIIGWYVMNLYGHTERNIGTAWMISFGNAGGIVATFSFLATDAPNYHKGYSICMGSICLAVVANVLYGVLITRENRRLKAAGEVERRYNL